MVQLTRAALTECPVGNTPGVTILYHDYERVLRILVVSLDTLHPSLD